MIPAAASAIAARNTSRGCTSELFRIPRVIKRSPSTWLWLPKASTWNSSTVRSRSRPPKKRCTSAGPRIRSGAGSASALTRRPSSSAPATRPAFVGPTPATRPTPPRSKQGHLAACNPPHPPEHTRRGHGKDDEEDGGLLGHRVTGLGHPEPHIDPRSDEPERDEDLDRPDHSDRRSRTAQPAPDQETYAEQDETPGDDLERMGHRRRATDQASVTATTRSPPGAPHWPGR